MLALHSRLLEAMAEPIDGWASLRALCEGKRAVGFGPGVPESPEMGVLLDRLLRESSAPVVVDASGLNLLAARPER